MYKIYDYDKITFKRVKISGAKYIYYINVNKKYIEVSKEIYLVLLRSYGKIKYNRKREVAKSVQYYSDMDLATSFIFNRKNSVDFIHQIYVKDLANKAIEEIYKLSDKYRDIAICVFLREMTIKETSEFLKLPKSTVFDRKKKIQKILKIILRKSG